MRLLLAPCLLAAATALAQAPQSVDVSKQKACLECGVVRSVRAITQNDAPTTSDANKPSGLVASIPLGRNAAPPQLGASTRIGGDAPSVNTRWEVIVRLDDGRFSVVTVHDDPQLREGDKVRLVEGKVVLRSD